MPNNLFVQHLTPSQSNKIDAIASKLSVESVWLKFVIYYESKFKTTSINPIGAVGLIQFVEDSKGCGFKTIGGKKVELEAIKKMTFDQQMDLVYSFLAPVKGKIKSAMDLYFAVFFPLAMQKSDDYVLKTSHLSASLIAKQNRQFDGNKDGSITKLEIKKYFENYFGKTNFDYINASTSFGFLAFLLIPFFF